MLPKACCVRLCNSCKQQQLRKSTTTRPADPVMEHLEERHMHLALQDPATRYPRQRTCSLTVRKKSTAPGVHKRPSSAIRGSAFMSAYKRGTTAELRHGDGLDDAE